jgi:glycosyltransferase involved in cell wall biosynthesis
MKILLLHQNFPGQFRHLAPALAGQGHDVCALGLNSPAGSDRGLRVINYAEALKSRTASFAPGARIDDWQSKVLRGHAAADAMLALRANGFIPDVVFAHSGWGEALFVRSVFPDTRLLVYAEYFYGAREGDVGFDPEFSRPSAEDAQRVTLKNTHLLHALSACDAALSPTEFQRVQHPAWAQEKIRVIHEGIDTGLFKPDPSASVQLKSTGLTLRPGDEVITFVARHLEPYRGYHIFMRALPLLQKLRPQARIVIVGGDGVSYGAPAPSGESWKSVFLKEVGGQIDLGRIHFVGKVPHHLLTQLMQVSAVHVYLTYPFVLSWSLLEAMSIACLIVASDTAPVREVIENGKNGILVDFFDPDALAKNVALALANRDQLKGLRDAAREAIVRKYDLRSVCLPAQVDFVLGGKVGIKGIDPVF